MTTQRKDHMATTPPQDEKKGRTNDPQYDVFRRAGLTTQWAEVGTAIHAANRRDAILKAAAELPEEDRYGMFATVRTGEFKPTERIQKTEPRDVWL